MTDQPQGEKPALTVVIQSWWTPALAVVMLVLGLLAGYFGRPLLNRSADTPQVLSSSNPAGTLVAGQPVGTATATADPTKVAAASKQLMDYLVSHTTHFQGDANAKVTIIEFSDYQ